MKIKRIDHFLAVISLATLASPSFGIAQTHSVSWSKVASGGGSSQSASYRLGGTIGQWDAGRSSSSSLTLVGGFWVATGPGSFTPGNLLVEGVGEGPPGLGNYGQLVWLEELATNGVLAQTKYMPTNYPRPTAAPFNIMEEGDQYMDGYPTRSADGQLICISGYNATNRDPVITSSSAATVLRVVGVLGTDRALDSSRAVEMFSGRNYYSVASKDGSGFWAVGEQTAQGPGGLVYFQPGAATNSLTNSTFRCVKIVNNQLYALLPQSSGGLAIGIYAVGNGLPTSGAPKLTQVFPISGSPNQFEFNPAMTIAYVADDRGNGLGGGIIKYTNNGTAWVSNYTLVISGVGNAGARGLVVNWGVTTPVIYATTTESTANRLVRIVDTGASSSAVTLRTAPASTAFRGVTWGPVRLVAPTILSERLLANREIELTFQGTVTQTYRILVSSNVAAPLANWSVLASGMFGIGPLTFTDVEAANQAIRFYRIVSP